MKAVLCPVCNGNGQVSAGFYSHPGDYPFWVSSGTGTETCQSCSGKGWVSVPEDSWPSMWPESETNDDGYKDRLRCPSCGGDRNSPPLTGCPMGSHYGTYCSV